MVRFASRPRGKIYPSLINPSRVATIATLVFRHLERIELDGWRRDFIEEETTLVVARGRSRDGANRVYLTKIRGNEINGVEIRLFFFFSSRIGRNSRVEALCPRGTAALRVVYSVYEEVGPRCRPPPPRRERWENDIDRGTERCRGRKGGNRVLHLSSRASSIPTNTIVRIPSLWHRTAR